MGNRNTHNRCAHVEHTKCENGLVVCSAQACGARDSMEDSHHIQAVLDPKRHPQTSFFGIYDGHCGNKASTYCQDNLHNKIAQIPDLSDHKSICEAVVEFDREMLQSWTTTVSEGQMRRQPRDGSTCIFALVSTDSSSTSSLSSSSSSASLQSTWNITVVNVGDCRALLLRTSDKSMVPLSEDHTPSNPRERKRIECAGGNVVDHGVGPKGIRVHDLNVSRTLGDFHHKDCTKSAEKHIITALPEICTGTAVKGDLVKKREDIYSPIGQTRNTVYVVVCLLFFF